MTEAVRRMTLKQAALLFFGDARHAATLRVEINRGNLVASRIGRAYWTTLPDTPIRPSLFQPDRTA